LHCFSVKPFPNYFNV